MPRSRSSGALSIESNERNCIFGLCFDNTLVIAAVSVVLPWSMCPIVPTFTWGLVRSNFFLAMVGVMLPGLGRYPLGPATAEAFVPPPLSCFRFVGRSFVVLAGTHASGRRPPV